MKNMRKHSKKQEERVAKAVRGRVVANSGATRFYKGDVATSSFLIECKTNSKEVSSVSVKKEWIDKNKEEAFSQGKPYTALAIDFGGEKDYFIIDSNLMKLLIEYIER